MGGGLSAPIKSKSFERRANGALRICACSMQGFRHDMEDAHTIELSLSKQHENSTFVGVYDGHSGKQASAYLKQELCKRLGEEDIINKETVTQVLKNIDKAFLSSSNCFRNHGSTAMFAIITPEFDPSQKNSNTKRQYDVKLAWVGDSRAFTETDGCITEDHKPNLPVEKKRIEAAGGVCVQNRVDGKLAVSRAIGDFGFKDSEQIPYEEQKVVGTPDMLEFKVKEGERMVIACDGLTEQMSNEQMMEILTSELKQQDDPAHALANLFEECISSGSQDNMSAILVEFIDGGDYGSERSKTYIPGPLFRARRDPNFVRAYLKDAEKYGVKDGVELRATAYGQDIREIMNTTNDTNLISEIETAISELDESMFGQGVSTSNDVAKIPKQNALNMNSVQLADKQIEFLAAFLENNPPQNSPDPTSTSAEESSLLATPNQAAIKPSDAMIVDKISIPANEITSCNRANGSKSHLPDSTTPLEPIVFSRASADLKKESDIISKVGADLTTEHEKKVKIIGGGFKVVTNEKPLGTSQDTNVVHDLTPTTFKSYAKQWKINRWIDQPKEHSARVQKDKEDISLNLKRKREELSEPVDVEVKRRVGKLPYSKSCKTS